ncbi:MAG: hypothetical protein EBZ51_07490 [Synechococcaceae bacterium WB9_2_112]|nr:hypothetical protein [Synechococcaceae bacterium WB9_2_112]
MTNTAMNIAYRVEAHDGNRWGFGIRISNNSRLPEFCGLTFADHFLTRDEAMRLRDKAARLCGGSLRVARVQDA